MNYKLAKQLKDAGFPQDLKEGHISQHDNPDKDRDVGLIEDIYYPTLSELIEACGDRFFVLIANRNELGTFWLAHTEKDVPESKLGEKTPESAVAKLWLKLNKERKYE